jgi:chromosomal replication initiation ATPase DnaA
MNKSSHKQKSENICVYLRIRPLNNTEQKRQEKYAIQVTPEGLAINTQDIPPETSSIIDKHRDSKFLYDHLFEPQTTTDFIFKDYLQEVVVGTLSGFNSTVFVYGQTGSGKTHTLMGQYKDYVNTGDKQDNDQTNESVVQNGWNFVLDEGVFEILKYC